MANRGKPRKDAPASVESGYGARLKQARLLRNLTQEDLATLLGIRAITISRNETESMSPSKSTFDGYVRELAISAVWLAYGEGKGPSQDGQDHDHGELLREYLASPLAQTLRPATRGRLARIRFADLGISIPTFAAVHDVALLLERHAPDT